MKVGLIGCGRWGQNIMRVLDELGVLAAICDKIKMPELVELRPNESVRVFNSPFDMTRGMRLDAVCIATPMESHHTLANFCMDEGLDVFVEKPMAITANDATEMERKAEAKGRILMPGHIMLYHPAIQEIGKILRDRKIGKINRLAINNWTLPRKRTRFETPLLVLGPHPVSLVLMFMGTSIRDVKSRKFGKKRVDFSCLYYRNAAAHVSVNLSSDERIDFIKIEGEKGWLLLEPERPIRVFLDEGVDIHSYSEDEPLKLEIQAFLSACKTRKQPTSDAQLGIEVMTILDRAKASLAAKG